MQNKPVGIFDSGVGGLSVVQDIQRRLPNEALIYIADSAFAPYGNKPLEFIQQRCHELTRFLLTQQAKAVVVACNTATDVAIDDLRKRYDIPVLGIEPAIELAASFG